MPRILIAEDDPGTAGLLKTLLELEGFQVSVVQQAQLVLSTLEQHHHDVLLMDYHLGRDEVGGLLEKIRTQPGFCNLPIVVMSGMECSWDAEKAGADTFLLKPFGADDLLAAIRAAIARRQ